MTAYDRCSGCHGDKSGKHQPACRCWDEKFVLRSHKDHEGRTDAICDGCVVTVAELLDELGALRSENAALKATPAYVSPSFKAVHRAERLIEAARAVCDKAYSAASIMTFEGGQTGWWSNLLTEVHALRAVLDEPDELIDAALFLTTFKPVEGDA